MKKFMERCRKLKPLIFIHLGFVFAPLGAFQVGYLIVNPDTILDLVLNFFLTLLWFRIVSVECKEYENRLNLLTQPKAEITNG